MTALFVVIAIAVYSAVVAIAAYFVVRLVKVERISEGASPRYSCMRCEMPYAIPDVPMRCRACGGMVEKIT